MISQVENRFIQPDPIISNTYDPQNLNRYAYVLNNPYKYVDPDGRVVLEAAALYTAIETGIDIASLGYSAYSFVKDPGAVNFAAAGADIADILSGPISNPGPSGPLVREGFDLAEAISIKIETESLEQILTEIGNSVEGSILNERDGAIQNSGGSEEIDKLIKGYDQFFSPNLVNPVIFNRNNDVGRRNNNLFQTPSGANPGPSSGSGSASGSSSSSSSSSSGSSSSGSSGSGSGGSSSGSGGGGGSWWCFGIFC